MKSLTIFAVVLATIVLISSAQGHTPLEVPPGIGAEQWIPITPTLGFVVTQDPASERNRPGPLSVPPTVRGYFVILRKDQWQRLEAAPVLGLHRIDSGR